MDHTQIVSASDLDHYASIRNSQAVIPELIYLLVKQSVPPPTLCRIPYGDAVNQTGWDGHVKIGEGFLEFVPSGTSYWEIGTGANPQAKATKEFEKRTGKLTDEERSDAIFVFVTPRSSASGGWSKPKQEEWLKQRKGKGWKCIRIIDGVKLADWVREFPAIGRWVAKKMGLTGTLRSLSTPKEHWELILLETASNDPPLPPTLFTEGRSNSCESLQSIFEGEIQKLFLFSESRNDMADFVAAYLQTLDPNVGRKYANRCLFVSDKEAWMSVVETKTPHVLVADACLELEEDRNRSLLASAQGRGHAVIVPLCGAWSGENPEIIKLRSPSQSQIEAILKDGGYSEIRARGLARAGGGMISALLRHLRGLGNLPPYATWNNASLLARVGLAGKWDGTNSGDRVALEKLLGKTYGERIETLRSDALRSDSPLILADEKWRFVARGEAWDALGNRIADDDLDRLKETAIQVLGERDPMFDLPKEKRFAARIQGKTLKYSSYLREGFAETLALLGSRSHALSSCTDGKAEITAKLVVQHLLNEATWDRWASLNSLLPLLAEAAPDEFLCAVNSVLKDINSTPFHEIFAQEGNDTLHGSTYMSGLLWALEALAWDPDHLSRVALILADIASFDPGGKWANRPANSLTDIFLPWHFQTTAPFEKRKAAIKTVLEEHPSVGWNLLLSLLPHNHTATSGCHRPIWREYIPRDWKQTVLRGEYWDQVIVFSELAVELAKNSIEKLCELVDRLSDLPQRAHEGLLKYLGSSHVSTLPESERLSLWEKLEDLVRRHRKFADAGWALPKKAIDKIEKTANILAPEALDLKYRYLFSNRDYDLLDEKGDYDAQRQELDKRRQFAVNAILDSGSLSDVLSFACEVAAPFEVGYALGAIKSAKVEGKILPSLLGDHTDASTRQLVGGYILARCRNDGWAWIDGVLKMGWNVEKTAAFLVFLPFEEKVWRRVSVHLGEENESLYWHNVEVNPYGPQADLTEAIEKLLQYGRAGPAFWCVSRTNEDNGGFSEMLATRALLSVLENPECIDQLGHYRIVEVIKRLQESDSADQNALFKIEWNFLPFLDSFSSGSPVTLEKKLALEPNFFAEVVSLVFRSRNDERDGDEQPSEQIQNLTRRAYELLAEWRMAPGKQDDGSFDVDAFSSWIQEVRKITEQSGHAEVAQIQIGHVLTNVPADPSGLWIHKSVADVLNSRDTEDMRSGFTTQLFNDRGVHRFTAGEEERELALLYRKRSEELEANGYSRFATAMRRLAEGYESQATRESKRDPFYD